jgi:hypothetical protein
VSSYWVVVQTSLGPALPIGTTTDAVLFGG